MDLEDVLRDLAPRLLRYATGRTGDAGLGEEIAQESLTALVQRWRRLGPPESPEAFVFTIARRRAGRSTARRRLLLPLTAIVGRAAAVRNPEETAVASAGARAIRSALRRLPRLDREALLLVVAGELRPAEAARQLGISESALKMRTHRGRRRLAALLHEEPGFANQD